MSRVAIAPEVGGDFDRIFDHVAQYDLEGALASIGDVIEAIDVPETNSFIGRPAPENQRRLIIGRGSRGHVALYRDVAELGTAVVLAVRSQREAGYKKEQPRHAQTKQ